MKAPRSLHVPQNNIKAALSVGRLFFTTSINYAESYGTKLLRGFMAAGTCAISFLAGGVAQADITEVLAKFNNAQDPQVLVASHRCGYKDTGLPENSLAAIARTIANGGDIIETDFRMTSDGQLVVMHDSTLNRTTNGTGLVSSRTLAYIKGLVLKAPSGALTTEQVPTCAEVMAQAKGKVMVNFDKIDVTDPAQLAAAMKVLRDTGTVDHAIFKGPQSINAVKAAFSLYPEKLIFQPVVENSTKETVIALLESMVNQGIDPAAIELIFASDKTTMLTPEVIAYARQTDTRIWINSLWDSLDGGHSDNKAIHGNTDGSWGWLIDHGTGIIQTDQTDALMAYLIQTGRRDQLKKGAPAK